MEEIVKSEHRAIVFKMNRKQAANVARYIKDHSGSPETIFAVDVDTLELIIQAKNAIEDDILVLEDAAHAFGAMYKGRKIGTIGDFAAFSFHEVKNITSFGEGENGVTVVELK